ncbi:MAG TPA: bifunctional riboflavin kinase/FAD synthetase [Candidatus Gastranaerophilales bacterium]|nr:bifunctional riboflavin kinase/FAD synthetase [Candidatus Gastranaerophilales bacterium]
MQKNMLTNSSLALGVFDGAHLGHQKVIKDAVEKARNMNLTSGVVTFSCHPKFIISGISPEVITPLEDKLQFFQELGVNATIVLEFNEKLAKMTASEYLKEILQDCLGVKSISVGYNHKLGSDKRGAADFLTDYCSENNINLSIISPVKIDGHTVSSSVIRGFITSGDVASAREFLGRPFKIKGEVIHGEQLGRKIGFPTANLQAPEEIILPLTGVYSGKVRHRGNDYTAVINVGRKPTVGTFENELIEAHLLNFNEDIYGEYIEVSFLDRIRDEKKFDSLEELKKQIELDCNFAGYTNSQ